MRNSPTSPGRRRPPRSCIRASCSAPSRSTKPPNDPLRPAEEKLIDDLASQAGLVPVQRAADRGAARLAPAPGEGAGRGAAPSGAEHPRRRAATAGGAGREGEPGADAGRARPGQGRDDARPAEVRSDRRPREPARPGARDLPAAARRQGTRRRRWSPRPGSRRCP